MRTLHSELSSRGDNSPSPEESARARRQATEKQDNGIRSRGGIPWSQDEQSQRESLSQSEISSINRAVNR